MVGVARSAVDTVGMNTFLPREVPPSPAHLRPLEHLVQHRLRQPPGERVLLARVIRSQERDAVEFDLGEVPELRPRRRNLRASRLQDVQRLVECEAAEGEDDAYVRQRIKLAFEERSARCPFVARRLIGRGRATDRGRDPGAGQLQPVVARDRFRPIGEAGPVQGAEEPDAGPVACELPPRPIRAVRSGREAEQQEPGVRVAEAGDGLAPVIMIGIGGSLLDRNPLPPLN